MTCEFPYTVITGISVVFSIFLQSGSYVFHSLDHGLFIAFSMECSIGGIQILKRIHMLSLSLLFLFPLSGFPGGFDQFLCFRG